MRVETREYDDDNDDGRTGRNDPAGDDPHYDDATEHGPLLGEVYSFKEGTCSARVPFLCLRFFSQRFRALLFFFRLANDWRDRLKFFSATEVH